MDEGLVELLEVSPCEAFEVLPCELGRARPCEPPAGGLDGLEDRLHGLELAVRQDVALSFGPRGRLEPVRQDVPKGLPGLGELVRQDVPASFGRRGRGAAKDALGSSSSGPRPLLENGLPGLDELA